MLDGLFTQKPLAVKPHRRDPTNKFRHYRGGYDVTSKHYWAVGDSLLWPYPQKIGALLCEFGANPEHYRTDVVVGVLGFDSQ